ncbi:adenosylcobinamide-GDP ribazoletransferase [Methylocaldum szegediense]|uniref:Adenosylcobinamide-GDP ribazoletransferase n=1 Tax=Methylocaldum szegediense TaxID=73780 RepID=A0ABN8X2N2_9GAMM|nr:adenosylcobinamide-GDP ribazoletransferase [Methylocaldum szegediense]CAI8792953.1 Adenosylcobinamide-GDP ribazoletransferase [Methylocaldum szegediense]
MSGLRPFLIALQFLTRLPVRLESPPDGAALGRSLLFYPLVGLGLGLTLAMLAELLAETGGWLPAAIVLTVWVVLTGALHLDGLADSADAWVGGLGDQERTLAIMKDPRSGPVAVVVVVLVLLLKIAALEQVIARQDWTALVLAPVLGRAAPLLLFLTMPYVRPGGLGSELARHLPCRGGIAVLSATFAGTLAAAGIRGFWPLLATAALFFWLRLSMIRRIGGTTGDTAGATIELIECAVLVGFALAGA